MMVVGNQASRTNSRTTIKNIHKYPLHSIPLHPSDLTYIYALSSPLVCYLEETEITGANFTTTTLRVLVLPHSYLYKTDQG
jgi:hypothetical protein